MMLGDNQRDKDMQRNNIIAIVLMSILAMGTLYLFPPPASQPPPVAPVPGVAQPAAGQAPAPSAIAPVNPAEPATAAALSTIIYDPAQGPAGEYALSNTSEDGTTGLDLVFTDVGARLKQGTVHVVHGEKQQLVPAWGDDVADNAAVYPLSLVFQDEYLGDLLNKVRWTAEPGADGRSLAFSVQLPEPYSATIRKSFSLSAEHPNVLDVTVTYTNNGTETRRLGLDTEPAFSLYWAPNVNSGDQDNLMSHQEIVWRAGEVNEHLPTSDLERPLEGGYSKVMLNPEWVAIKSAFFIVAMKPEYEGARAWALGDPLHFQTALDVPRTEVAAGASDARSFKVYVGPLQGDSLAQAWPGLNTSLEFFTMFGIMDTFAKGMLWLLNWFYNLSPITANYGFAIIFLTIVVRTAMFPLTLKGMKSMKKMQKLAPEMEKLKEEVGDDQQELQKRMMELYRERGVNPLGGCMPMLLQMPIFIALYRVYATAFEFRGAPFLGWIDDLSKPDALFTLPFAIPLPFTNGIEHFNLLPFLMGGAMVLSTKLMPTSGPAQNPQQKMIMTLMPIFFSAICYNMASGLNLYILTSTLLGIVQNYFVHVSDDELKAKPGAVAKKKARPKHFYAAAQARKRDMAREERRAKKKGPRGKGTAGKD